MRITSGMITNTTLLHINRNMRNMDEILRQIETTKRVGVPSDNPIIASRALKFRTGVTENAVFQSNVASALGWLNMTDSAMTTINTELFSRINELLVTATTDTNNPAANNKHAIVLEIESLFNEIAANINQTMAGRYVFSGQRTDEPPVFKADNTRSFVITQNFGLNDIARTSTFQRLPHATGFTDSVVYENVSIINLAYANLTTTPPIDYSVTPPSVIEQPALDGISVPGFHIRKISIDHPDAYLPEQFFTDPNTGEDIPILHLVAETGELVMHNDTAMSFPREGISVTYRRDGFSQGELNPSVYFESREIVDGAFVNMTDERVYRVTMGLNRMNGEAFPPQVGTPPPPITHFDFELDPPPDFDEDGENFLNANDIGGALGIQMPRGAVFTAPNIVRVPIETLDRNANLSVSYCVIRDPGDSSLDLKENLNLTNVTLVRAHEAVDASGASIAFEDRVPVPFDQAERNRSFSPEGQDLRMEFSSRTVLGINTHAGNVLTDKMFGDFRRLFEFSNAVRFSSDRELREHFEGLGFSGDELTTQIEEQQFREQAAARGALYHMLNNMRLQLNSHMAQSNREQTVLGARMVRFELLENRLETDEVTLTELQSSNEDTDMIAAIALRMSAEAQFMASLQANSGIIQMSLANFIRI